MQNPFWISFKLLGFFSLTAGALYPLLVWGLARPFFRWEAEGSLVFNQEGKAIGSELIAQDFTDPIFFHPRPSASGFQTLPSGASNLGATSQALKETIEKRKKERGQSAPADLVMASGSGLDPHLSPQAALFQVQRIVEIRKKEGLEPCAVASAVRDLVEEPTFGVLGQSRVNVLKLNLWLKERCN